MPAFRTFAEVLFCVVALQTIAPTLNYMGFLGDLSPIEQQLVVAGAKLAAAVALVAILRFSKAPLLSVQVFKVVTPVLILLLFAVPFAPAPYLLGLLAAGSCLHFVVMNSLFCIDAIAIAQRHRLVFEAFYGADYLLLMGFCSVLEKVMPQLLAAGSSAELLLVFGVFFSVYVLSMVLVLVRRHRRDEDGGTLPSDRFVPDADTRRDGFSDALGSRAFLGHRHHRRCSRPSTYCRTRRHRTTEIRSVRQGGRNRAAHNTRTQRASHCRGTRYIPKYRAHPHKAHL